MATKIGTIYKTPTSKEAVLALYDRQLEKLGRDCKDRYVETHFGKTHLIETGNFSGPPLLLFHGGNSTTAYNLLLCQFLLDRFHVYAVDIVGHPGKSAETTISPRGYGYGEWAGEVIDQLGFSEISCFGGSFGGGVLAKLMCVAPQKVTRSVLIVPSGIGNAFPIGSMRMMFPLLRYLRTGEERYIRETALVMAIREDVLDPDTLDIVKCSFDHVKTKVGMPSNVSAKRMACCTAPTLVMAGELDCLFPAKKVLRRAQKIIPHVTVHELEGRGHMHLLTQQEKDRIIQFLDQ